MGNKTFYDDGLREEVKATVSFYLNSVSIALSQAWVFCYYYLTSLFVCLFLMDRKAEACLIRFVYYERNYK